MSQPLNADLAWIAEFLAAKGRPLRVLHIGNIANNAYNNAKIQRMFGIEADVVCHDYYHIMGCPEWEDAEISGDIGDAFYPNWWTANLNNWQRPEWFVQGPRQECLEYLRSRNAGDRIGASMAKNKLVLSYSQILSERSNGKPRDIFDKSNKNNSERLGLSRNFNGRLIRFLNWIEGKGTNDHKAEVLRDLRRAIPDPRSAIRLIRTTAVEPARTKESAGQSLSVADRIFLSFDEIWLRNGGRPIEPRLAAVPLKQQAVNSHKRNGIGSLVQFCRGGIAWLIARSCRFPPISRYLGVTVPVIAPSTARLDEEFASLHRRFFPQATSATLHEDIATARNRAVAWHDVLPAYDIVQGYSTDGIIPLYCGRAVYAAYEHGTLRNIPFDDDTQGRLCRITYSQAERIFVTNTDVLPSVERLEIPDSRVVCLPHAFNDGKLRKFRDANPHLQPPVGAPVFFSPTRHHWSSGDTSWLKGNDIFIRGAAVVANEGRDFRIVFVDWGQEAGLSKALIDELGLTDRVTWVPTMNKTQLWTAYCQSHAVVDQFNIPAIGGVAFETLALGIRLLTRIDEPTLSKFFGEAPPILNAATPDEVAQCLRRVVDDPVDHAGFGLKGRRWIETFHSAERTVALQAKAYRAMLQLNHRGSGSVP